jgi:hypothetical protein
MSHQGDAEGTAGLGALVVGGMAVISVEGFTASRHPV